MKKIIVLTLVGTFLVLNCQKNKFKAKHFLPELYDYKIAPELEGTQSSITDLTTQWSTVSTSTPITNIESFKSDYVDFLLDVENILFYNIGDISATYVYGRFYKADIDTTKIWNFYNSADYFYADDIQSLINSEKGVVTVEYLLFNPNASDSLNTSSKYINFIDAHLNAIKNEIETTKTSWSVYKTNFETMTETGINGSYNMVVNQIIHGLEEIIVKKMGNPLINTSNLSSSRLKLINQSISQRYHVYMGNGTEKFNSVYNHVRKKDKKLADEIKLNFENLIIEGDALVLNYTDYLDSNTIPLEKFRNNVESLMLKFKIDVISIIDITLTIGDSDGD